MLHLDENRGQFLEDRAQCDSVCKNIIISKSPSQSSKCSGSVPKRQWRIESRNAFLGSSIKLRGLDCNEVKVLYIWGRGGVDGYVGWLGGRWTRGKT